MATHEYWGNGDGWDFKILATDISTEVLKKARQGVYSRQEVLKAPPHLVQSYFSWTGDRHNPLYAVHNEIKQMVVFRRLNLLEQTYPFTGLFDLIMCRNVMIYFDQETKEAI